MNFKGMGLCRTNSFRKPATCLKTTLQITAHGGPSFLGFLHVCLDHHSVIAVYLPIHPSTCSPIHRLVLYLYICPSPDELESISIFSSVQYQLICRVHYICYQSSIPDCHPPPVKSMNHPSANPLGNPSAQ